MDALELATFPSLAARLHEDDDPALWARVLETVLTEIDARWGAEPACARRILVGVSRVTEWQRPHQTRWTGGGGFAAPETYRAHAYQQGRWQAWLVRGRDDARWWELGDAERQAHKRRNFVLRLAVPGRTRHHGQAAVSATWQPHAPWPTEASTWLCTSWYGFRLGVGTDGWRLVAAQDPDYRST